MGNLSRDLATAVIAYSAAVDAAQDDPAAMSSAVTVQGDDLDAAFERMYALACEILGLSPAHTLAMTQRRGSSGDPGQ
jgi:hypothetical protein